jgi:hypothetical protein
MDRKDLVKELLGTIVPAVVCKTVAYVRRNPTGVPNESELTAEIIRECDEIPGDSGAEPRYAGPFGDVASVTGFIIEDIIASVKEQLEQEIMMKLHIKIDELRGEIVQAKLDLTNAAKFAAPQESPSTFGLPSFEVTESVDIAPIKTGYDSISKYNTLADNPLFAMVSKSVDRMKKGDSAHSAEDFNAARKDRADSDTESAISNVDKKFHDGIEEEIESNSAWDKMFAEKYGAQ